MIRSFVLISLIGMAGAVSAQPNGESRPLMPVWHTDARHCVWVWREGGGVGLWAETCHLPTGRWEVAWDGGQGAFRLRRDGEFMGVVVQSWQVRPEAGIEALTKALIDAGQLAPDADCRWVSVAARPVVRTQALHALSPKAPGAFLPTPQGDVPDPLCGPYGASTHGVRYFILDLRWPGRAVFVDEGQERPMFDPASITVMP